MQITDVKNDVQNPETAIVNVHFEKRTCLRYQRDVYMAWDGQLCKALKAGLGEVTFI